MNLYLKKLVAFSSLALVSIYFSACNSFGLRACFEPEQVSEYETTILFNNCSRNATTYLWKFGDGKSSTEESPTHKYREEGTYNVTLTALGEGTDVDGETIEQEVVVKRPRQSINITTNTTNINYHQRLKIDVSGYAKVNRFKIYGYIFTEQGDSFQIFDTTCTETTEPRLFEYNFLRDKRFYHAKSTIKFALDDLDGHYISSNSVELTANDKYNASAKRSSFFIERRVSGNAYGFSFEKLKGVGKGDEKFMDFADATDASERNFSGELKAGKNNEATYYLFPEGTRIEDLTVQDHVDSKNETWTDNIKIKQGSLFAMDYEIVGDYLSGRRWYYPIIEITEIEETGDINSSKMKFRVHYFSVE
ncbi:MAG: PKD domain-containing protein [Bacteroidia bacterium]